jgi:hypothetical protein
MARVTAYFSGQENGKPVEDQVYHNDDACAAGRDIRVEDKHPGTGRYPLCKSCK